MLFKSLPYKFVGERIDKNQILLYFTGFKCNNDIYSAKTGVCFGEGLGKLTVWLPIAENQLLVSFLHLSICT